jgi:hypothetical protein|nr:MAG TPA: DNA-packaging protein small subunit [Bacteriophage sp.]
MVKDVEQNIDVFENDVDKYLQLFLDEQGIEDMRSEPQNVWSSALMYIQKHVFKNNKMLKMTTPPDGYRSNDYSNQYSNLNQSNCNAYDLAKVKHVCDIYIYECMLYDKIPTQQGFVYMTGITADTICRWKKDSSVLSKSGSEFLQNLYDSEEEALMSKAFSLRNPTGALAALNHKKGWREDGKLHIQQVEQKTADQLPRLDAKPQDVVAIEDSSHKM